MEQDGNAAPRVEATPLVTLAIRLPAVFLPPSCDESIFATGGNVWLRHEGLIYRDLLDNKPPAIYLVYGLSRLLLDSPFTDPRIAAGFCAAATAVLIALFAAKLLSPAAGILGGLAFALLSTAVFTPMAYTEAFMLPFSLGGLWLAWRSAVSMQGRDGPRRPSSRGCAPGLPCCSDRLPWRSSGRWSWRR